MLNSRARPKAMAYSTSTPSVYKTMLVRAFQ